MKIRWYNLKDLAAKNFKDIPTGPGIYFVRWSKNGKPVVIPRLGGIDWKGILYIGSAKNLREREFKKFGEGLTERLERILSAKLSSSARFMKLLVWMSMEFHGSN